MSKQEVPWYKREIVLSRVKMEDTVTMTKNGPKIANVLLNGVLDKYGPTADDLTVEHGMYEPVAVG